MAFWNGRGLHFKGREDVYILEYFLIAVQ
jgi:hypothetical protein